MMYPGKRVTLKQINEITHKLGEGWSIRHEPNRDGDYGYDQIYSHNKVPVFKIHIPGCRVGVYAEAMIGWK